MSKLRSSTVERQLLEADFAAEERAGPQGEVSTSKSLWRPC